MFTESVRKITRFIFAHRLPKESLQKHFEPELYCGEEVSTKGRLAKHLDRMSCGLQECIWFCYKDSHGQDWVEHTFSTGISGYDISRYCIKSLDHVGPNIYQCSGTGGFPKLGGEGL